MLYINIPAGMKFLNASSKDATEDRLVSEDGSLSISIQTVAQQFYSSHKDRAEIMGLECSKKKLTSSKTMLEYRANRNGKAPSDHVVLINPIIHHSQQTRHFGFWASNIPFGENKRNELDQKRKEQRDDRRHVGDSPKPT